MRTLLHTLLAVSLLLLLILSAACGKGKNPATTRLGGSQEEAQLQVAAEAAIDPLRPVRASLPHLSSATYEPPLFSISPLPPANNSPIICYNVKCGRQ